MAEGTVAGGSPRQQVEAAIRNVVAERVETHPDRTPWEAAQARVVEFVPGAQGAPHVHVRVVAAPAYGGLPRYFDENVEPFVALDVDLMGHRTIFQVGYSAYRRALIYW